MLTAGLFGNYPSSSNFDIAKSLFDPDSMWFVHPQLLFHCVLCPIGARVGGYNSCTKDIQLYLIFLVYPVKGNSQGISALSCSHSLLSP
jgi:hypothetical protein